MHEYKSDYMPGIFIAFDGLDGSGLSTQSLMLRDYLIEKDRDVVLTKEQTEGLVGGIVKSAIRGEWKTSPLALQLLFAADRAHHVAMQIEPSLEKNKTVICDRYILSALAYGSFNIDMDFMKKLNSKFRKPDINFIIDTPPEICLDRIKKSRSHLELFEEKEKLEKIRQIFLSVKSYFPETYLINGNRRKEEVFNEIKQIVDRKV